MFWIIAIIVIVGLFYAYIGFKGQKNEVEGIYLKLATKRNGQIIKHPLNPIYPALKFNLDGEDAYFAIYKDELDFLVVSDKLKKFGEFWVRNQSAIVSFKRQYTKNPVFDEKFILYKAPEDLGTGEVQFSRQVQSEILKLQEEVLKKARNIFLEARHVNSLFNGMVFEIKVKNFLLNQEFLKVEAEQPSVYDGIIDCCVQVYSAYKKSIK